MVSAKTVLGVRKEILAFHCCCTIWSAASCSKQPSLKATTADRISFIDATALAVLWSAPGQPLGVLKIIMSAAYALPRPDD